MLKLKLQYFGHLKQRADLLEKTPMLGKIEGRKRRGWQRMRWLDGIADSTDMSLGNSRSWWWTGRPGVLWFMGLQRVGHDWVTELNWVVKSYHKQGFREQKDPPPSFSHHPITHPKNMLSQKILCKFRNDLWAFWNSIRLFPYQMPRPPPFPFPLN